MDFRNMTIDCDTTFGDIKFKKVVGKTFKYVDGERTDQFIGYKILVESTVKRDVFEVKVMDESIDRYTKVVINQEELYNQLIEFDELLFNVNLFKGKLYYNLVADSFNVFQND